MIMHNPLVSVIIPCFNRERYIGQSIDSVLGQTYDHIEVVVVDDGCTDGSREIMESYGKRIVVIEHECRGNKGQSASINAALRRTKGSYVAILDSDDLWAPEKIERQVSFLEANPDVGLVYANGFAVNERGKELYELYPSYHRETGRPERVLLECQFSAPSSYVVRRSVLDRAGEFDETMRSAQDHDMAIRLAEITKVAYMGERLWFYRRHDDSQSHRHAKRRWKTGFRILKRACERRQYGWDVRRRRLAVLHFRMGQCMLEERQVIAGLVRFAIAGLLDPLRGAAVLLGFERWTSPH